MRIQPNFLTRGLLVLVLAMTLSPASQVSAMSSSPTRQTLAPENAKKKPLVVDVYWSMRSPYCYIALDRLLALQKDYNVELNFKPVWPIAIKDPEFFVGISKYMEYRVPYQDLDTLRSATFAGMPYRYPDPDPVAQKPNFGAVLPMDEQDNIKLLTYTAVAAAEMGKGWDYLNQVSRMMWNGSVRGWDKGDHFKNALNRAGLDADQLIKEVKANPAKYDTMIKENQKGQDKAGFGGVPLMVFNGENFFGQDRIDQLIWRMKQYGLEERSGN